jgi:hypothetical protein
LSTVAVAARASADVSPIACSALITWSYVCTSSLWTRTEKRALLPPMLRLLLLLLVPLSAPAAALPGSCRPLPRRAPKADPSHPELAAPLLPRSRASKVKG